VSAPAQAGAQGLRGANERRRHGGWGRLGGARWSDPKRIDEPVSRVGAGVVYGSFFSIDRLVKPALDKCAVTAP
jgi:hypothetical protein